MEFESLVLWFEDCPIVIQPGTDIFVDEFAVSNGEYEWRDVSELFSHFLGRELKYADYVGSFEGDFRNNNQLKLVFDNGTKITAGCYDSRSDRCIVRIFPE